jgi:hypothetical protein
MRPLPSIVVIVWVLASLLPVGCGRSAKYVKNYTCDTLPGSRSVDVRAVWDCNRNVMVRASRKKKFSLREFWGAAEFFETLTGTAADTRDSRQGPLPGPDLRENLDTWDRWYLENEDRLVWDPATRSIRLSPADQG